MSFTLNDQYTAHAKTLLERWFMYYTPSELMFTELALQDGVVADTIKDSIYISRRQKYETDV